jgi:hypothetical protein
MSASLEKPYRQRIYKVVKSSETDFVSYIHTIYNFQGEPIRKGDGQPGSGWNNQGVQVWGAEKGGYEFLRAQ